LRPALAEDRKEGVDVRKRTVALAPRPAGVGPEKEVRGDDMSATVAL